MNAKVDPDDTMKIRLDVKFTSKKIIELWAAKKLEKLWIVNSITSLYLWCSFNTFEAVDTNQKITLMSHKLQTLLNTWIA